MCVEAYKSKLLIELTYLLCRTIHFLFWSLIFWKIIGQKTSENLKVKWDTLVILSGT